VSAASLNTTCTPPSIENEKPDPLAGAGLARNETTDEKNTDTQTHPVNPELVAIQCIAAQPDLLNSCPLCPRNMSDRDMREALNAALAIHKRGELVAAFSIARELGKPELSQTLTAGDLYGKEAETFTTCCADVLAAFRNSPSGKLLASVEARRVTKAAPPAEPETRIYLAGKPVCTPGNLTNIISKAKTGKTAGIGGILASAVAAAAGRTGMDTLRFNAANPAGKALVLMDTEQSTYDAYLCLTRALDRAGEETDPPWLCAYSLAGVADDQLRSVLPDMLDEVSRRHGGIFAVILDGVADFVADVNDPKECNPFVAELHGMAIRHDCPIINVIHSNEGQRAGDDGRGHLGKQLTRKAESNLLLKKTNDVTVITSEKQRKAPITEADGVAFKWSDAEQRHVSCGAPASSKDAEKKATLTDLAAEVFGADRNIKWSELERRIGAARNLKGNTPGRRIDEMKRLGVIKLSLMGNYERIT
jgi:hypothetical protein